MTKHQRSCEPREGWPRWWRLVVVAVSTLILCSCATTGKPPLPDVASAGHGPGAAPPTMVAQASPMMAAPLGAMPPPMMHAPASPHFAGHALPPATPFADPSIIRVAAQSPPYPEQVMGPPERAVWGLPQPPPECIFDGGDRDLPARVSPEWTVQGLEPEDTIGHADTLDGSVIVAPSNRVKIYAPRFAAVRSVVDLHQEQRVAGVVNEHQGVGLQPLSDSLHLNTHLQRVEARGEIAERRMQGFGSRAKAGADLVVRHVLGFHGGFLPHEDFSLIRRGIFENSDKPRLASGKQAANTWSHDLGVQVTIDGRQAASVAADQRVQQILLFEDKSGPGKLRVIKVASTSAANVGDVVDFTIRYDNVGDQVIGNVTIIDNLTPRLEYVEGTAQASRAANFSTKANEAGSLELRWEVIDPLPKGEGGLVRFKCRVR